MSQHRPAGCAIASKANSRPASWGHNCGAKQDTISASSSCVSQALHAVHPPGDPIAHHLIVRAFAAPQEWSNGSMSDADPAHTPGQ